MRSTKFQIGKNGVNLGVITSLELAFTTHRQVRISVLKSSGRDKNTISDMAEELKKKLKGNYSARVIGFTIILTKLGKA